MSSRSQEKQKGTRCELCNISTPTAADIIDHDASLMHHMKLDQFHNGSWVHRCQICGIQAGKLKNYIFHMKGKKHEANLVEEKAKWTGKLEFRTPKTFFLSTHQNDHNPMSQNKNHGPNKEVQMKNRNNSPNAPSASVSKFTIKPSLVNLQQQSWAHQAYGNVPWSNQNSYSWAPNNYDQQNMENPFWNNTVAECNWGASQYNDNNWNPEYANQWSNNVNNSWGNNFPPNLGLQYGYLDPNPAYNQSNSNIKILGRNSQDNTTTSNSESAKTIDVDAKKKARAKSSSPKRDLNRSKDSNSRRDLNTTTHSRHSRDSNHSRHSYRSQDTNKSRDSTQSSGKSRELPFTNKSSVNSKPQNKEDSVNTPSVEVSSKGQKSKKNNEMTKSNFKEKKEGTTSDSNKNSSVSNSRDGLLSKKKNSAGIEKFRRDNGKRSKDGNESAKKSISHNDEKDNDSPDLVETGKTKNSNDTVHLYFLSSDSDGEGHKSHKWKKKWVNRDDSLSVPTTSKNKKGEGCAKSLNHIIISRLVNHPCTPRQQMQLTKWLQSQTASKNLILPSSNLPQSEENNALANVMSELPEDILNDLYKAIQENEVIQAPEMEVCLKSEPSELESGNIPWVEFLKSLELSKEQEHQDIVEEDSNLDKDSADSVSINKESTHENSKSTKEKRTCIEEAPVSIKVEPIDCELEEVPGPSSSSQCSNVNELLQNSTTVQKDSSSVTEPELRTTPLPQQPLPSERSTPSSIPRRPPSISSCCLDGSIDQSQKEINDWINKLPNANIPDCSGATEQVPRENETISNKNPSQDIIDNLLYLNSQEEQLREESQKVEQVISQLYRLLEEWKNKRNEIVLQETTFRNKRLKLLESLKGAVSNENTIPLCHETQPSSSNVQYLGTLESTLNFVQELGTDLGINIPFETSQNVISSTNCEVVENPDSSSKSTKKNKKTSTKTKKAKSYNDLAKTTKNLKTNSAKVGQSKKARKRKEEQTTITSSTSTTKKRKKSKSIDETQSQERMLEDYMSTLMPEHLGTSKPLLLSSSESVVELSDSPHNDNSNDILIEENTFGPVSSHDSAVIDIKVFDGFVYSCSTDKTAKKTNLRDQRDCITYAGHGSTVSSIKLYTSSSGETKVFTSCHDSYLRCFNSETGECISKINLFSPIICMSLEWNTVFLGLQNGQIIPYNIQTSKVLEPILGSDKVSVGYLYASSEGCNRLLFIVDYNGVVTVRNAMTGLFIRSLAAKVKPPCRIMVHSSSVYITTMEKTILIFDLMTGALQRKVTTNTSSATGIKFQRDIAICCYLDGSIKCFTKQDWKLLCVLYSPDKTMTMCMDLSKNWIFTGNKLGIIQGFKYDFHNIITCKYLLCSIPFGRESDLKLHIEQTHFERTDFNEVIHCPWKNCEKHFRSQTVFSKMQHVLSHL